ncbi:uncharacterized protein LOC126905206 [Daktulosphaira vitifoliae]|uniref:uncharacterized protein LOC126905206 n=1 Tax=Daktulosphaira vitifoliae TaxID=58002 RepID=UPI0021AA7140|nr:uncharacterized protein LOC126905206 [Daktulosphaira vitifoliae]
MDSDLFFVITTLVIYFIIPIQVIKDIMSIALAVVSLQTFLEMKLSKKKNTLTKTVEPITNTRTDLTTHPINLELPTMTNNSILEQSPSEDKITLTPIIENEKEPSKTSIKKITIIDDSLNMDKTSSKKNLSTLPSKIFPENNITTHYTNNSLFNNEIESVKNLNSEIITQIEKEPTNTSTDTSVLANNYFNTDMSQSPNNLLTQPFKICSGNIKESPHENNTFILLSKRNFENESNKNSDTKTKTSYNFSTVSKSATKQGILKKIENYDNNSAKNIANIRLIDTYQEKSVRFHKNTEVKHFNCNLSLTKQVKKYQWRRQNYNLTKY